MKAGRPRVPSMSIRTLVVFWAGSVFLAWAILVAGWFAARGRLEGFSQRMAVDSRALGMALELELTVLDERRPDLFWQATSQDAYCEHRDAYHTVAERIVSGFAPYMHSAKGRELLDQVRQRLATLRSQSASPSQVPLESLTKAADELLDSASGCGHTRTTACSRRCRKAIACAGPSHIVCSDSRRRRAFCCFWAPTASSTGWCAPPWF